MNKPPRNISKKHKALMDFMLMVEHGYSGPIVEDEFKRLLRACKNEECDTCGYIVCPHKDRTHFSVFGCRSCEYEFSRIGVFANDV